MMDEESGADDVMQKNKNKEAPSENSKTWKRSEKQVNTSSLFIGDSEQLELQGTQIAIKIDGFRTRVLIDAFYFNNKGLLKKTKLHQKITLSYNLNKKMEGKK